MPSARKQKNINLAKSSSNYVHPSLETRSAATSAAAGSARSSVNSVNERIEYLRRAQTPRATPAAIEAMSRPSLSPVSIRRRTPGPPPPRSWLEGDVNGTRTFKYGAASSTPHEKKPRRLDYFPGLKVPPQLSLLHQSMMSMAGEFDWHLEYDHVYLCRLPAELKMMLLSYIACHGPESGLSLIGLKTIFHIEDTDDPAETTANDEIDCLDLGSSIGRNLHLNDIAKFLQRKSKRVTQAEVLDSWELSPSLTSNLRFPALTKLSLAHPGPSITWSDLLSLSRNLGSLSHLSLAYWPAPRLSSSMVDSARPGVLSTSSGDPLDLHEAAYLLRMLSRNTPSLQYLSFEGCGAWSRVLRYDTPSTTARRPRPREAAFDFTSDGYSSAGDTGTGIEWTTSWRNLTHLDLSQGWIPRDVDLNFLYQVRRRRAKYDTSFSAPSIPPSVPPAPAPDLHLQPRIFPNRGIREAVAAAVAASSAPRASVPLEHYTITAPSSVAESVQASSRRREWCQLELEALRVDNWVRMLRRAAGCKVCTIEHGWDAKELMEAGYAEQDLFAAGF